jgi:hypothetical protein
VSTWIILVDFLKWICAFSWISEWLEADDAHFTNLHRCTQINCIFINWLLKMVVDDSICFYQLYLRLVWILLLFVLKSCHIEFVFDYFKCRDRWCCLYYNWFLIISSIELFMIFETISFMYRNHSYWVWETEGCKCDEEQSVVATA